jgi:hypothetical protein
MEREGGDNGMRYIYVLILTFLLSTSAWAGYKVTGNLEVTGNAGIGSSAPSQKLDVVGTAKATRFEGDGSGLSGVVTTEADTLDTVVGRGSTTSRAVTIGTTTAGTVNKVTITAPASGSTLTIADGKTLTVTNTVNINTLTDGKWCKYTASGMVLNCDQNEPAGSNYWALGGSVGINTTNNVGIGSTEPSQKLDVVGTVKATLFSGSGASLTNIPSDGTWTIHDSYPSACGGGQYVTGIGDTLTCGTPTGSGTVNSGVAGYFGRYPDTGTTIDDDAVLYGNGTNIGLGSTVPRSKLDVVGTVTVTAITATSYVGVGTTGPWGGNAATSTTAGTVTTAAQPTITSVGTLTSLITSGNIGVGTTALNARLTVIGGNVGIGSTVPSESLEVVGSFAVESPAGTYIVEVDSTTKNVGIGTSVPQAKLEVLGGIYQSSGTVLLGLTSGNIGLGSTVPAQKLDVSGTTRATAFIATGTGNVGIGTSVPLHKFAVTGTSYFNGNIGIGTTTTSNASLQIDSSIYLGVSRSTGYALCIMATGFLGHCTTTPTNGACTCSAN